MANRLQNDAGEPLMTAAQMNLEDELDAHAAFDEPFGGMSESDMERADAYAEDRAETAFDLGCDEDATTTEIDSFLKTHGVPK